MKARRESREPSDPSQNPSDSLGQVENPGQSAPDTTEVNAQGKQKGKGKGKGAKGKEKKKKGAAMVTPSDRQLRPR